MKSLLRYYCLDIVLKRNTIFDENVNMSSAKKSYTRITTKSLFEMKANGEKIAMLTAYDYTLAGIVDQAGIDIILVGDSASNVMAGHETTLPITLDQMIYHASSVIRAVDRALVVVDLPFGTYQADSKEALRSAIRIMKESGAHAVKLEGGHEVKESIERILQAGIPVMGHLGLTPQSIYKFGTYTVRAKEKEVVNLVVSQYNGCRYCQSAHTAIGKMNGFSDEQILEIRTGSVDFDAKLDALAKFTLEAVSTKGKVSNKGKEDFFNAGYNEANMIDVVVLIGDKMISNYIHNLTNFEIDFPVAPEL